MLLRMLLVVSNYDIKSNDLMEIYIGNSENAKLYEE